MRLGGDPVESGALPAAAAQPSEAGPGRVESGVNDTPIRVVGPRLLLGWIVLICAELFSGASLKSGLWHPWTLVVTYWLYFAHFFFLTTLAVRTGRTSFLALYLWGVLFGLYESWITKVIWHGYSGDGKFVMGALGPYGFSEIGMVFLFHPLMSFILPLAVACVLFPALRPVFPELGFFTGTRRWARLVRVYLVLCFACVIRMNSGGTKQLLLNLVVAFAVLLLLHRFSRASFSSPRALAIVAVGSRGLAGLCVYLMVLYGLGYFFLRPEGLPSAGVQGGTLVFYGLAILGLWMLPRRIPLDTGEHSAPVGEGRRILLVLYLITGLGLALTFFSSDSAFFVVIAIQFAIWTPVGFVLMALALISGMKHKIQCARA